MLTLQLEYLDHLVGQRQVKFRFTIQVSEFSGSVMMTQLQQWYIPIYMYITIHLYRLYHWYGQIGNYYVLQIISKENQFIAMIEYIS